MLYLACKLYHYHLRPNHTRSAVELAIDSGWNINSQLHTTVVEDAIHQARVSSGSGRRQSCRRLQSSQEVKLHTARRPRPQLVMESLRLSITQLTFTHSHTFYRHTVRYADLCVTRSSSLIPSVPEPFSIFHHFKERPGFRRLQRLSDPGIEDPPSTSGTRSQVPHVSLAEIAELCPISRLCVVP